MPSENHDLRPRLRSGRLGWILGSALIAILFGSGLIHKLRKDALHNPSLEDWISRIQQPGYRLVLKQSTNDRYFALFDAGGSQMAICSRDRKPDRTRSTAYRVTTPAGDNVWCDSLPDRSDELHKEIHLRTLIMAGTYSEHYGAMYPIRPDHVGPLRVIVEENERRAFDEVVMWPPEDDQRMPGPGV
jgi:hypothetical protein